MVSRVTMPIHMSDLGSEYPGSDSGFDDSSDDPGSDDPGSDELGLIRANVFDCH